MLMMVIPAIILAFVFIHLNYKKYPVFSTLNEIMLFKKMIFNKKFQNCAGKKTTVSFFVIILTIINFIYTLIILYTSGLEDFEDVSFSVIIGNAVLLPIILLLITRLIYEFVIIPIAVSNNGTTNQQQITYVQQQNYVVPNQVNVDNQSQQAVQNPVTSDIQFKFCSQCGTRYNASDGKCPNCGMQ